jgi:anti-sigma B factor antagonist
MFGGKPTAVVDASWSGSVCTLTVRKEFDVTTATNVNHIVSECLDKNPSDLVINMRSVEYIDSFGVGLLVSIYQKTRSKHVTLRVTEVHPAIQSILQLANLHRLMTID